MILSQISSVPKSMLPTKVYDAFNSETGTMMAIFLMKEHLRMEQWKQSPRSVLWRASSAFKWYVSCCYRYEGAGGERDTVVCIDRGCTGDDRMVLQWNRSLYRSSSCSVLELQLSITWEVTTLWERSPILQRHWQQFCSWV